MKSIAQHLLALIIAIATVVLLDRVTLIVHAAPAACKIVAGIVIYLFATLIASLLIPE